MFYIIFTLFLANQAFALLEPLSFLKFRTRVVDDNLLSSSQHFFKVHKINPKLLKMYKIDYNVTAPLLIKIKEEDLRTENPFAKYSLLVQPSIEVEDQKGNNFKLFKEDKIDYNVLSAYLLNRHSSNHSASALIKVKKKDPKAKSPPTEYSLSSTQSLIKVEDSPGKHLLPHDQRKINEKEDSKITDNVKPGKPTICILEPCTYDHGRPKNEYIHPKPWISDENSKAKNPKEDSKIIEIVKPGKPTICVLEPCTYYHGRLKNEYIHPKILELLPPSSTSSINLSNDTVAESFSQPSPKSSCHNNVLNFTGEIENALKNAVEWYNTSKEKTSNGLRCNEMRSDKNLKEKYNYLNTLLQNKDRLSSKELVEVVTWNDCLIDDFIKTLRLKDKLEQLEEQFTHLNAVYYKDKECSTINDDLKENQSTILSLIIKNLTRYLDTILSDKKSLLPARLLTCSNNENKYLDSVLKSSQVAFEKKINLLKHEHKYLHAILDKNAEYGKKLSDCEKRDFLSLITKNLNNHLRTILQEKNLSSQRLVECITTQNGLLNNVLISDLLAPEEKIDFLNQQNTYLKAVLYKDEEYKTVNDNLEKKDQTELAVLIIKHSDEIKKNEKLQKALLILDDFNTALFRQSATTMDDAMNKFDSFFTAPFTVSARQLEEFKYLRIYNPTIFTDNLYPKNTSGDQKKDTLTFFMYELIPMKVAYKTQRDYCFNKMFEELKNKFSKHYDKEKIFSDFEEDCRKKFELIHRLSIAQECKEELKKANFKIPLQQKSSSSETGFESFLKSIPQDSNILEYSSRDNFKLFLEHVSPHDKSNDLLVTLFENYENCILEHASALTPNVYSIHQVASKDIQREIKMYILNRICWNLDVDCKEKSWIQQFTKESCVSNYKFHFIMSEAIKKNAEKKLSFTFTLSYHDEKDVYKDHGCHLNDLIINSSETISKENKVLFFQQLKLFYREFYKFDDRYIREVSSVLQNTIEKFLREHDRMAL